MNQFCSGSLSTTFRSTCHITCQSSICDALQFSRYCRPSLRMWPLASILLSRGGAMEAVFAVPQFQS
ncbi:hypothetical protein TYRP_019316 [Tyrophagus putrescentiae]|nr:hypothetical protein TYRP_019316 [Tyrophagus putrescentiae]